jgi:hypothetical protein
VKGTDRSIGLFEAAVAAVGKGLPPNLREPLVGICDQVMSIPSFAYTFAACEVEVDPETGASRSSLTPRSTIAAGRSTRC